jgi:hypothetical protein
VGVEGVPMKLSVMLRTVANIRKRGNEASNEKLKVFKSMSALLSLIWQCGIPLCRRNQSVRGDG